ncbi:hypothetical protein COT50_00240 [candidate division WWE3 bacterium CG08_land_8_20_14_0_20_41_10]|uniref:Nucleotidyl transferase AbiEii/AbiGii toxin family protein n=1 Tax=candidate division WWE3 bacterium CG08_land_8_20_14_0_20_41_10 TaxID=1975085 RepID=A0A2H0XF24_UNCKA|nr:MAG: hypothetical protein COT50_00240 [candidate division WWE3 bacterium CG08_land_8_20_14_0_20_41_10]
MDTTIYYKDKLYPLQDKVLKIINALGTPFYLTGGTALSRCYFNHRYSDDLDFFVNKDANYQVCVAKIIDGLTNLGIAELRKFDTFSSFKVADLLKVDLVNDIPSHIGGFNTFDIYSKVDNLQNILSNKISALVSRDEPKDVVDIWTIARSQKVDWKQIFVDVSSKAVGIFPPKIAERLETFPLELLDKVIWIEEKSPDKELFKVDLQKIIDIMLQP